MKRKRTYEAAIMQLPDGTYTGQIIEHRGALTEGKTLEEVKKNLAGALKDLLDYENTKFEKELKRIERKHKIIRANISIE